MSETNEEKKERCFVIMPISDQGDYPAGHFTKVYEQIIKPSVEDAGYEAYRVDENNICDAIINKIFSAIQECPMAICDLSNRNPNVLYELGLRQAYDKPVVLIQDDKTQKIFDVSGISTVFYKSTRLYEDVIEARENIKKAILSTKEGKVSTLVKVIKASTADFSKVEVSQDDRTNIILEGIYNEIRELKNKEEMAYWSPIVTGGKGIMLSKNKSNTVSQMSLFFMLNNPEIMEPFVREIINKLIDLCSLDQKQISENLWRIYFGFIQRVHIESTIKAISEIAAKFNIEIKEENFIY